MIMEVFTCVVLPDPMQHGTEAFKFKVYDKKLVLLFAIG